MWIFYEATQSLLTKKKHHRSSKRGGNNNKHLLKPNSNHPKCKTSASIYTIKCQVTENKIILLESTVLTPTSEVKIVFFILLCCSYKPTLTSVLISREWPLQQKEPVGVDNNSKIWISVCPNSKWLAIIHPIAKIKIVVIEKWKKEKPNRN